MTNIAFSFARAHSARPLVALLVTLASLAPTLLPARSQAPSAAPVPTQVVAPTCRAAVDSLDAKIRQNYAGFLLEVKGTRRTEYDALLSSVRREAASRPFPGCFPLLRRVTDSFNDPHLFVLQSARPDSTEAVQRRAALRTIAIDEAALRRELTARQQRLDPRDRSARLAPLDPIEGIWFDGPTRYAVIPDPSGAAGRFLAVLLTADSAAWPVGAVRGEFVAQGAGRYAATLRNRDFAELQLDARIHRQTVLRLSPGMWGKAFPVPPAEHGLIDTVDVHRPRVVVREKSVVVTMPSHDGQFTRALDAMVAAADSAIRSRGLLIIDLRGNEGGGSLTSRALHPYIATATARATPYDAGTPVMLSSPAQIAYAKRFTGTDTSAFVRALVARMEAAPGQLVPLEDPPSVPRPDPSYEGSWRVVVLVDGGTVSASEVLVLRALRSTRATVIGESTAGALDYQSTQIVGLGLGDRRWALGYPTITAHADLPARGMRGKGIAPHVTADWSKITDAIAEVERRHEAGMFPP